MKLEFSKSIGISCLPEWLSASKAVARRAELRDPQKIFSKYIIFK
jgi:hypothetical protein